MKSGSRARLDPEVLNKKALRRFSLLRARQSVDTDGELIARSQMQELLELSLSCHAPSIERRLSLLRL